MAVEGRINMAIQLTVDKFILMPATAAAERQGVKERDCRLAGVDTASDRVRSSGRARVGVIRRRRTELGGQLAAPTAQWPSQHSTAPTPQTVIIVNQNCGEVKCERAFSVYYSRLMRLLMLVTMCLLHHNVHLPMFKATVYCGCCCCCCCC